MKINIILPGIGQSGGMDVVYKYADLLSNKGHDVIIYKNIIAINLHRYGSRLKNYIHCIYRTFIAIKTLLYKDYSHGIYKWYLNNRSVRNADIVIATSWPTAFIVNKLDESKGSKFYFIQGYEIWDNRELGIESYRLPLNKIVISSWVNQKLRSELGMGPFPIVYNGIDLEKYNNPYKSYEKYNSPIQLLMLNHKLEKKGVKFGLSACTKILNKYKNVRLVMFGICDNKNLPPEIVYYENPDQKTLVNLYRESDIFIFPSLEEGWGLTVIEAMACKCAVVGSNVGCMIDIGHNSENALLSEPGDVNALCANIERLIVNNDLLQRISENGYKTILELDWQKSASKLETILLNDFTTKS